MIEKTIKIPQYVQRMLTSRFNGGKKQGACIKILLNQHDWTGSSSTVKCRMMGASEMIL